MVRESHSAVRSIVVMVCCVLLPASAFAQDDVIARARAAAADGRRAEGLALLDTRLAAAPDDVDARLVYGLILSWDGRYDEARAALTAVLAQAPDYLDARVALMNVEWWSGRDDEARALTRTVLARDPGNTQARLVKQRLDARTRRWQAGVWWVGDTFSDDRESWNEWSVTAGYESPVGTLVVRGSDAERFGLEDQQIDVEFYPVFRAGTYAFVGLGFGDDDILYPDHRIALDLYQSIGNGFEMSGGFRHLVFAEATTMYAGALTKYAGNWMLTFKASMVPEPPGDEWSYYGTARRYFGPTGKSFIGLGYSHGFTREEPRGAGDLLRLNADTIRGQADLDVRERLLLSLQASRSREDRTGGGFLWQNTFTAGLVVKF
jgi:YaiO family outer membrane protein